MSEKVLRMARLKKRKAVDATADDRPTKRHDKRTKKQAVSLNDLKWKSVDVPGALDDYEGFFGLEEVDDIEIIKTETGQITFQTSVENLQVEGSDPPNGRESLKSGRDSDEESWEGFSDDENAAILESGGPKDSARETDTLLQSTGFNGLEDELLDDGIDMGEWNPLDLPAEILHALSKLRFQKPTPIQRAAIPEIVAGHDVVGKASTGSGKTLAFGIPIIGDIIERISYSKASRDVSALVLAPTRELAHQISAHLNDVCAKFQAESPRVATITGGLSVQKQERLLSTADIVIGTPGRLWEIMTTSMDATARLKKVKYLVLDEADRLLSQGNFQEVEEILNSLDRVDDAQTGLPPRQTLIFSATFDKGLQYKLGTKTKFDKGLMSQRESLEYLISKVNFREEKPKFVDVDPTSQLADGIKEALVECVALEKDLYLYATLLLHPRTRTLIFTNSISAVRRITPYLQNLGLPAQSLHSNMIQKARLRAVEKFTKTASAILVSTDVAARGLDIAGVELIVHYHLPRTADAYVHRAGRTARGEHGRGASIVLCAPDETAALKRLVARVHGAGPRDGSKYRMPVVDVDRRLAARLKPRATLAKRIADVALAKAKGSASDNVFRQAAEDLGVEYDSAELEAEGAGGGGRHGRGNARRKQQRADRDVGKAQVDAWRAELRALLAQRVNVGVSERYLARGVVDVEELLRGEKGEFLGAARMIEFGN